jgi:hypothetical protein
MPSCPGPRRARNDLDAPSGRAARGENADEVGATGNDGGPPSTPADHNDPADKQGGGDCGDGVSLEVGGAARVSICASMASAALRYWLASQSSPQVQVDAS